MSKDIYATDTNFNKFPRVKTEKQLRAAKKHSILKKEYNSPKKEQKQDPQVSFLTKKQSDTKAFGRVTASAHGFGRAAGDRVLSSAENPFFNV